MLEVAYCLRVIEELNEGESEGESRRGGGEGGVGGGGGLQRTKERKKTKLPEKKNGKLIIKMIERKERKRKRGVVCTRRQNTIFFLFLFNLVFHRQFILPFNAQFTSRISHAASRLPLRSLPFPLPLNLTSLNTHES